MYNLISIIVTGEDKMRTIYNVRNDILKTITSVKLMKNIEL